MTPMEELHSILLPLNGTRHDEMEMKIHLIPRDLSGQWRLDLELGAFKLSVCAASGSDHFGICLAGLASACTIIGALETSLAVAELFRAAVQHSPVAGALSALHAAYTCGPSYLHREETEAIAARVIAWLHMDNADDIKRLRIFAHRICVEGFQETFGYPPPDKIHG